jgi:hypothetical protein
MPQLEHKLIEALRTLETAVQSMPAAQPKPNLIPLFHQIDAIARSLPPGTDPQLRHFLANKSYQKARALLETAHTR